MNIVRLTTDSFQKKKEPELKSGNYITHNTTQHNTHNRPQFSRRFGCVVFRGLLSSLSNSTLRCFFFSSFKLVVLTPNRRWIRWHRLRTFIRPHTAPSGKPLRLYTTVLRCSNTPQHPETDCDVSNWSKMIKRLFVVIFFFFPKLPKQIFIPWWDLSKYSANCAG